MDFDDAKENIQPLASGRNASLLQASLSQESGQAQELLAQRKQWEDAVRSYAGEDPLEPWYAYVCWIEQSYPAGGSGSGLHAALYQCLTKFEKEKRYRQDRRLIKLFIKFMEKEKDQIQCYQQMYNDGIGTMLAEFYIAWAYSYDLSGNMRKADEIFRLGIDCRAEPLDELREAHQHFGYTVAQRMLYTDSEEANAVTQELNERRLALQSLRGRRNKRTRSITVGSVRTGSAVKSELPGVIQMEAPTTSRMCNAGRNMEVFNDENVDVNMPKAVADVEPKTSLRSIIDAAREQENVKESVAWNMAHTNATKIGKIFGKNELPELGFDIHEDAQLMAPITEYERSLEKPFKFPPAFVSENLPQEPWVTPVTIEDEPNATGLPCYQKCLLYPRPNLEFSPEEHRAYEFLKKRFPNHPLVVSNEEWWGIGQGLKGIRCYPNFAKFSKPQHLDELDNFWKPPPVTGMQVLFDDLYNDEKQIEYQPEELLAIKLVKTRNLTVCGEFDMDETVCLPGNKMPRRKSFFPTSSRKSLRTITPAQNVEEDVSINPISVQLPVVVASPVAVPQDNSGAPILSNERFVVPAPPAPKIEIYEDAEELRPTQKPSGSGPFFEGDETCSTQMFNMFLKTEAVSTPRCNQKQLLGRQFGNVLKDLSPVEDEALDGRVAVDSPLEPLSPTSRKKLSTILETSEHGTQSLATSNATTKSTITSVSSSPGSHVAVTLANKDEYTPCVIRHQRNVVSENVGRENPAGNFSRHELWEANAPSVPLLKSLRFQEDKTETIPKPLTFFQEDKTETLSHFPLAPPEISVQQTLTPPLKVPSLDEDSDLCGFFGKTPPKVKPFGSPMLQATSKRVCDQATPEIFVKTFKKQSVSRLDFKSQLVNPSNIAELVDSFKTDLSFVPETQPMPIAIPDVEVKPNNFEIFLDETETLITASKDLSLPLNCTLPETQTPINKSPPLLMSSLRKETKSVGTSHITASFMKDFIELSSCPPQKSQPVPSTIFNCSPPHPNLFLGSMYGSLENVHPKSQSNCGKSDNFEVNAATEMFATNISMIKNSTLISPNPPHLQSTPPTNVEVEDLSIYYKAVPLTPIQSHKSWRMSVSKTPIEENFVHPKGNMEESVLNETIANAEVNPFNVETNAALLESIDFSMYIEKLPHCQLVGQVKRLHPNIHIEVHDERFEVLKMVGKGAYGSVYRGRHLKTGKKVALKQERPPNFWEFYICLEVHSRLTSEQMIPAYAHIDYALVGNNSSIYISEFSDYGSLIEVCNKVRSVTNKNLDEYVVMHMSCQMLDIVDHLHAMGIIHADIKPDNFLIMRPLCAHPNELSLQLIDFGVAIDTKFFPPNQTFKYVHHDELFKCVEMRTGRPWTYQLDLFGLVGVMHVLLLGRYMEVEQRNPSGVWMPKTALPRYVQRYTWESIYRALLNIRDCRTMPNLQQLRTLLKSELLEKEKFVNEAILKFNNIIKN
ncbi:hypothetical protein KR018_003981 [Drosophila ironensis]|nr:hypothetical protein KR018_003981 [Drosophila ironensis]